MKCSGSYVMLWCRRKHPRAYADWALLEWNIDDSLQLLYTHRQDSVESSQTIHNTGR